MTFNHETDSLARERSLFGCTIEELKSATAGKSHTELVSLAVSLLSDSQENTRIAQSQTVGSSACLATYQAKANHLINQAKYILTEG